MKIQIDRYVTLSAILAAIAIIIWAVSNYAAGKDWVFFWILAAITIPFSTKLMLSVLFTGTPLLMAIAMAYGVSTCVIAATAYALLAVFTLRLARAGKIQMLIAAAAFMVCEAFVYSLAYHLLRSVNLFVAIMAMTLVSYLATSLVRNPNERWIDRFPLILNPFLAASCAAFVTAFQSPLMPLLSLPVVAVIRYWTGLHECRLGAA